MSTDGVVIVAKKPDAGRVKTRLCPPLSPHQAAALADAFLGDTIAWARGVNGARLLLGYAGDGDAARWFADAYPGIPLLPQGDGDLGARMERLFGAAFDLGCQRVALVGADTPHLPSERVRAALDALATPATVALGPALDGGYYLIALRHPCPALFREIGWSGPHVLEQTLDRAAMAGLTPALLPPERDIDTPGDLAWLHAHIDRLHDGSATAQLLPRLPF